MSTDYRRLVADGIAAQQKATTAAEELAAWDGVLVGPRAHAASTKPRIGNSKEVRTRAKFPGPCAVCHLPIQAGTNCFWLPGQYRRHPSCDRPKTNAIPDGNVGERMPPSDQGNQAQAAGPIGQTLRRSSTRSPDRGHLRNSRPPGPCRGATE